MHVLEDTGFSPSLLVYPLWLLFLLRLELGICWPLGCNHKNWRISELLGLLTLAFKEDGVALIGVLDVGGLGIIQA